MKQLEQAQQLKHVGPGERMILPTGDITIVNKEGGYGLFIQIESRLESYQHSFLVAMTFKNFRTGEPCAARVIEHGIN